MPLDSHPIISVRDLTKYCGSTPGVQDINFSVDGGEIFGNRRDRLVYCLFL